MVKALVEISKDANQVLNIVKAKHNLHDKSQAINLVVSEYGQTILEPELRPEFIERSMRVMNEKRIHVGTPNDLRKMMGLE